MGGMSKTQSRIAVLFSALLPAASELRLLPAGRFTPADGRKMDVPSWHIDGKIAEKVIARFTARTDDRVIDYEHQTILTEKNGKPAPAAGWFSAIEWREGDGLYAIGVKWTDKAAAMIAANEYRYLSPVFSYDKQGNVLAILHAAITNNPGLDGLTDLTATLTAHFQPKEETDMDLKQLLAALGLGEDKTEADALTAITALKAKADKVDGLEGQVATLKAQAPDPAKFVPAETVAALQGQVAALTAQISGDQVERLVQEGLADGRILPPMEGWARELGKKGVAELKAYLDNASPVAALKGTQSGGSGGGNHKEGELDEGQLAVCRQMSIDPEAYKATLAEQAAA
jgi:phage I-like protein